MASTLVGDYVLVHPLSSVMIVELLRDLTTTALSPCKKGIPRYATLVSIDAPSGLLAPRLLYICVAQSYPTSAFYLIVHRQAIECSYGTSAWTPSVNGDKAKQKHAQSRVKAQRMVDTT